LTKHKTSTEGNILHADLQKSFVNNKKILTFKKYDNFLQGFGLNRVFLIDLARKSAFFLENCVIFAAIMEIKSYLRLQLTLINRKIRDFGMNPVLGHIVILTLIALAGWLLFIKIPSYAPYITLLLCIYGQSILSQKQRSDFLYIVYGDKTKRRIRIIENLIVSIPFITLLLIESQYIEAAVLPVVSVIMAFFEVNSKSIVLPTPFSKKPYEFAVGFRKTFLFVLLIYALSVISVCVNNLNLGLFSVFVLCLLCATYYGKVENEYYVWIFSKSPNKYLMHKILTAIRHTFLMTLPAVVLLTVFFPDNWWLVLLATAIGAFLVITFLLAAYSVYPGEIGLLELIFILSVFIPPFVLVVIPYFYVRSVNHLKNILV